MFNKTENRSGQPSRKKMLWCWAVLCLVSSMVTAVCTYLCSPAHDAIRALDEEPFYCRFEQIYADGVEGSAVHRWIFNQKMLKCFDEEFDSCREILHTDEYSLRKYIDRTASLLQVCHDPVLTEDIRQKFDALAAEVYAHYPDSAQAYNRARDVMGWIVRVRCCSDKTKADYAFLLKVGEMEQRLSAARYYESKGVYDEAVKAYRQAVEHPRYGAEAQAAADRCLTEFRKDTLTDLYGKAAADMDRTWAQLKRLLELTPDDAELQQLCTRFEHYINHRLGAYLVDNVKHSNILDHHEKNPGFTQMLVQGTDGDRTVTDAGGRVHDPFNLYIIKAAPPNQQMNYGCAHFASKRGETGITRVTFTMDPSAACGDGQAVLEVFTKGNRDDYMARLWYTSPVLTKNSDTLTVDLKIEYDAVVILRLSTYGGPVEFLIDNAYIETYRP